MTHAALIISILALIGTFLSLFLQKKAYDREKRKELRENKKSLQLEASYNLTTHQDLSIGRGFVQITGIRIQVIVHNVGNVRALIKKASLLSEMEEEIYQLEPNEKVFKPLEPGETEFYDFYIPSIWTAKVELVQNDKCSIRLIDHEGSFFLVRKIKKSEF